MSARSVVVAAVLLAGSSLAFVVVGADAQSVRPLVAAAHPSVDWTTTDELARSLASDRPPLLLDVRTEEEFAVSHLRGAMRVDPEHPSTAGIARDGDVAVYCSIGWRSAVLADQLEREGHARVVNLEGGIFAWANEGRELVRGDTVVREVHPYDVVWGRWLRSELRAR